MLSQDTMPCVRACHRWLALWVGLLLWVGMPESSRADPTGMGNMDNPTKGRETEPVCIPRHQWVYENTTGFRSNPLGLGNEFRTGYRYRLIVRDSPLFNPSALDIEALTFLTPAFARFGPRISIQPVAVLKLSAAYEFMGTFSAFKVLNSFDTPRDDYSPTELTAKDDAGDTYATIGRVATLSALLQAKVSLFAVRSTVVFEHARLRLQDGDRLFYNPSRDILHQNGGWVMQNDLDTILVFDFGLVAGSRYSVVHGWYSDSLFPPGVPRTNPNGPHHRIGPLLLYTFFDRPGSRFNAPAAVLIVQWYARHRYRTGVDVNTAIPNITAAFIFQGLLLPKHAHDHEHSKHAQLEQQRRKRELLENREAQDRALREQEEAAAAWVARDCASSVCCSPKVRATGGHLAHPCLPMAKPHRGPGAEPSGMMR